VSRVRRRPVLVAVAAVVAVLAAGLGAWWWLGSRDAGEVSRGESLAELEARGGGRGDPEAGVPVPGVYEYDQSGWERGGVGPISIRRDLPSTARMLVAEAAADGYLSELSLASEHVEAVRYVVVDGWARGVWRRSDVRIAGIGRDDRRAVRPPARWMPLRPRVGLTWRDEYQVGPLPVEARSEVLRRERVVVGGERVEAFVVHVVSDTGGDYPGTRTETIWWAPALALPVRWRIDSDTGGLGRLHTVTDLRLRTTEALVSDP
jgi:hypothetical protein